MAKFQMGATVTQDLTGNTARLGGDAGADKLTQKDLNKIVKLAGESRFDLAAVGDAIEGVVVPLGTGTQDGYQIGNVVSEGFLAVTFDGAEDTGTGALAIGDYVVAGTPVAVGTALTGAPKVRKATSQTPGAFAWRVVSLGAAGTGAVGTTGVVQRV